MMHSRIGVLSGLLCLACVDATAPPQPLAVVLSVGSARDAGAIPRPVRADGRLGSVHVEGGPGLTCGVSAAQATALLDGHNLTLRLTFDPLHSCPFAGVETDWDAILPRVPAGLHHIEVRELYFRDLGERVLLSDSVYVGPGL